MLSEEYEKEKESVTNARKEALDKIYADCHPWNS